MRWVEPRFDGDAAQYPFHFLPYASQAFNDGSSAHLPWLQEMPDPLTSAMWSSWVEINPQTAERMGVVQGDLIDITAIAEQFGQQFWREKPNEPINHNLRTVVIDTAGHPIRQEIRRCLIDSWRVWEQAAGSRTSA